ncbi:MAG: recombination mediator RecR [bacterium]
MGLPPIIQKLAALFSQLPSVGPKTAERYVFYLLKQNSNFLESFGQNILDLQKNIVICENCLSIATSSPCQICNNKNRQEELLCIVADTRDMLAIEETKQYNGYYHILGGIMDTIEGSKPNELNINQLMEKINKGKAKEVILALNPDLPGETTCLYLTKMLKPFNLTITRLAQGLPTGASLEYADQTTLGNALKFRKEYK